MRSLRPGNHDTLSRSRWHLPSLPVQLAASRKFSDQRLHERAQQPTRRRDQRSGAQEATTGRTQLAVTALKELEQRDQTIMRQWQMRIERAQYEAALAEQRYQECDPANRLVAGTLERRWNDA